MEMIVDNIASKIKNTLTLPNHEECDEGNIMNQYLESEKRDTQYIQNEYTVFDWNYKKILQMMQIFIKFK